MNEMGSDPAEIERKVKKKVKMGSDLIKYIAKTKTTA